MVKHKGNLLEFQSCLENSTIFSNEKSDLSAEDFLSWKEDKISNFISNKNNLINIFSHLNLKNALYRPLHVFTGILHLKKNQSYHTTNTIDRLDKLTFEDREIKNKFIDAVNTVLYLRMLIGADQQNINGTIPTKELDKKNIYDNPQLQIENMKNLLLVVINMWKDAFDK